MASTGAAGGMRWSLGGGGRRALRAFYRRDGTGHVALDVDGGNRARREQQPSRSCAGRPKHPAVAPSAAGARASGSHK